MNFSFSAIYMTVFATNLMVIVLALCFRNSKIMTTMGYRLLALFTLFAFLRAFFPLELVHNQMLPLPEWFSEILVFLRYIRFKTPVHNFSIWSLLAIIWLIGCIVLFIRALRESLRTRYYILSHGLAVTKNAPYNKILNQICEQRKRKLHFEILQLDELDIPLAYGLFHHYILIPSHLRLTEDEWYYVLGHEAAHHFNYDLYKKLFVRLITIVYWWNPFCHLLSSQCDMILEMQIDHTLTTATSKSWIDYVKCLLNVADQATDNAQPKVAQSAPLLKNDISALEMRFQMMAPSESKRKYGLNILFVIIVISIFILSYLYTFEAYYVREDIASVTVSPSSDGSFAVQLEDGSYDIYLSGFFIENVNSLEYYPSDLPILTAPPMTEDIPNFPQGWRDNIN
ncbi:MAG: M56 family metallopeptidase [Acetatifactor sp.]|nr:M56 family metallopeptidase [Acetatifactor sp.]